MSLPPPLPRSQQTVDADHLRLLRIFHFVAAGLSLLGLVSIFFLYSIFSAFLSHPQTWMGPSAKMPPDMPNFGLALKVIFGLSGVLLLFRVVGNIIAACFIPKHQHRTFSLVVAVLNCFHFPLGTALGIFTIIVLVRPSVVELYKGSGASPAGPSIQ